MVSAGRREMLLDILQPNDVLGVSWGRTVLSLSAELAEAKMSGVTVVQIAGSDPQMIAEAARRNVDAGAQIIDVNMGCPAKKVCNKAAGSALLRDEPLVVRILETVVAAVNVPVTLKIRTGWSPEERNATRIARIADRSIMTPPLPTAWPVTLWPPPRIETGSPWPRAKPVSTQALRLQSITAIWATALP